MPAPAAAVLVAAAELETAELSAELDSAGPVDGSEGHCVSKRSDQIVSYALHFGTMHFGTEYATEELRMYTATKGADQPKSIGS